MSGFTYAAPASSGHSGGGHSPFGFVGNLVHDVADAAKGTPEGLVQLAEHPLRSIKGMGKATWQTWSPLFHGHVGEFGHNFYAHPLAPMLDIATVFTGGASLAAMTGVKAADLGLISEDSALARLGSMPKELKLQDPQRVEKLAAGKRVGIERTKHLPTNPIYNKAYRSAMSFADKHPSIPNWFGSAKTYKRLDNADWANSGLALHAQYAALFKAAQMLDKGGHSDFAKLEQDLNAHSYRDLWLNSPEISVHELMNKYHGQIPEGYKPIRPDLNAGKSEFRVWKKPASNVDELAGHFKKLGEKMTRPAADWQKAVYEKNGQGFIRLAHNRAMENTMTDGAKSAHFLARMFRYPTAVWKYSMVGASPRTVIDNGVGNWVMFTMRQGGAHAMHGFLDAVRYTRGERKAMQVVRETGRLPADTHWLTRYFKHDLGNTFGTATLGSDAGNTMSKLYRYSVYPLVHKYADVPVRAASISAYLRGDMTIRGLMKAGKTFDEAAHIALRADKGLRERALLHARTVAGNYTTLSKTEQMMRDWVPFYLWDKHIVMHTANMLRDRPGVVAAGAALGQQGANAQRKILGDIPEFMLGQLPIHIGGQDGRTSLLDTTGLNPYSTIPDLAGLAQALTTGHTEDNPADTILSTVNPLIKGLVEQTMGSKATGSPAPSHGGVLPSALTDLFNSMRPVQLARAAAGMNPPSTTPSGSPRLYKSDINTILSTLAGFPVREADIPHAVALEQTIKNHGKKPKKGRGFTYGG